MTVQPLYASYQILSFSCTHLEGFVLRIPTTALEFSLSFLHLPTNLYAFLEDLPGTYWLSTEAPLQRGPHRGAPALNMK